MNDQLGYIQFDVEQGSAITKEYRAEFESRAITVADFRSEEFEMKIRILAKQAEEIASSEGGVPFSEKVANDALFVFHAIPSTVVWPDLIWLEDGGLSLEWQKPGGIVLSVSIYGDSHVIWGALLGKDGFVKAVGAPFYVEGTNRRSPGFQSLLIALREYFV